MLMQWMEKVCVILLITVVCVKVDAMDVRLRCNDGQVFEVAAADAKLFGFIKKKLADKLHAGLDIPVVHLTGQSMPGSRAVGSLFQVYSGMSPVYLTDECLKNACAAAYLLKAPANVTSQLERVALLRGLHSWVKEQRDRLIANGGDQDSLNAFDADIKHNDALFTRDSLSPIALPLIQAAIRPEGVLDLHNQNLVSTIGCVFSPSAIDQIAEVDLSNNLLSTQGLDEFGSFACLCNLRRINLANNQIEELPANIFANMPSCVSISLANNKIACIKKDAFKRLRSCTVNLCGNPIRTIEEGALDKAYPAVTIVCSKSLQPCVLKAIENQLTEGNKRNVALIGKAVSHELVSGGCLQHSLTGFLGVGMALIVFPIALKIIDFENLSPEMAGEMVGIVTVALIGGVITLVILYYRCLTHLERACDKRIRKYSNRVCECTRSEEQKIEREMFPERR